MYIKNKEIYIYISLPISISICFSKKHLLICSTTRTNTQMRAMPHCLTGWRWFSCERLWARLRLLLRLISNLKRSHTHSMDTYTPQALHMGSIKHYFVAWRLSLLEVSLLSWNPAPLNVKQKMTYQSPIHLSVSSLTLIPLAMLSVSVAPRGAASQRSHLSTALLCFPPTFCPPCPVGWRVTDWHLSPRIWSMLSDWEMAFCPCIC